MNRLIFIDTNVFLDFYRIRNSDVSMKYLSLIDKNHDKIIITDQVEMEFKKHRLEIIYESLKSLKSPEFNSSIPPAIVSEVEPAKIIEKLKEEAQIQHKNLKDNIFKILENPAANDKVYQTLQRLFTNKNSDINLNREKIETYRIRKLAFKRFFLGYPPRKKNDTSLGDALNWEWIIQCCKEKNKDVIIVSRDNDYGIHFDNKSIINDFLNQEFHDRVSNKTSVLFTNKLSVAFKGLSNVSVTKKMEDVEKNIIREEQLANNLELENRKRNLWKKVHASIYEIFNEDFNNSKVTD
jgi:predicted nucleic acid-binding protein